MAELNYQDLQRAAQDAVRGIQNDVSRLANDVATISARSHAIEELQRTIQQLQGEIQRHDPRSEQVQLQIQRDIQELKVRFEVIEKFCRDMSQYFQARVEEEKEDDEYRRVGQ